MVTTERETARVGDRVYQVEWCSQLVFDEAGDVDRDQCKMKRKFFFEDELDKAKAFAEKVWPKTQETFGIVELDLMEMMPYDEADREKYPHLGYWEAVIDTKIFSGEWES